MDDRVNDTAEHRAGEAEGGAGEGKGDDAGGKSLRQRLRTNPATRQTYRIAVGVVGTLVVVGGLVAIPFPGPGWLMVIAGLAILASEFEWANRLLQFTKRWVKAWTDWVMRQAIWVRILIGLATAGIVYGVLVLSLHLTGVPGWIPQWVPLSR